MSISAMRAFFVGALCAVLSGAPAANAETYPYTAYAVDDGVPARSGPGSTYYSTTLLKRGTAVQVYRRASGNWLAIRPLPQSHSWVPVTQLKPDAGGAVGQILQPGVAWIGSSTGTPHNHKWQVRLRPGEKVRLLGTAQLALHIENGPQSCYKIAPPSGEFRWVDAGQLSAVAPVAQSRSAAPRAQSSGQPGPIEASVPLAPRLATENQFQVVIDTKTSSSDSASWSPRAMDAAPRPQPAIANRAAPGLLPVVRPIVAATQPAVSSHYAPRTLISPPATAVAAQVPTQMEKLADLALLLGDAVSRPAAEWQLESLRERAVALIESGSTALQRGQARLMLDRIDGFRKLQVARLAAATTASASAAGKPSPGRTDTNQVSAISTAAAEAAVNSQAAAQSTAPREPAELPADVQRLGLEPVRSSSQSSSQSGQRTTTSPGLMSRIMRTWSNVRSRTAAAPASSRLAASSPASLRRSATPSSAKPAPQPATDSRIDEAPDTGAGVTDQIQDQGWLVQVHSERGAAPPYALVNRQGQILQLVTPVAGLKLDSHLKKQIKLTGQAGFSTSLKQPHLRATSVTSVTGM